jgi:TolB-like protein/Tfp pilus assembly protein PilF
MLGQAISTVDVKEPSTQVELQAAVARSSTREGLARQLRGDLDAIVLKALARDPADRYESAKAVREDLERYLQNHPIKAYRAPFAYRVKKFVSRHRPVIGVSALASALLLVISGYQFAKRETTSTASPPFSPPPHSIGVLPFSNLSGDPTQEYFSDGMSEELIDVLSHFDGLQVAARTSSFSLKGKNADIRRVARELGVGAILEGSIRRSGNKVRITAQLVDAVSGFRLWSETYDRDAGDVLRLQSEIARAVASALRVTLLGDGAANAEVGATRDPAAFDAYLRAATANATAEDAKGFQDAIAAYTEAIKLDANYALAFAGRSRALSEYAEEAGAPTGDSLERAQADARQAITLAPGLAEGHLALARIHISSLDVAHANEELERARALAPGNVEVLGFYGDFAVGLGHAATGIAALRRAAALDPLNANSYVALGFGLFLAHQYDEAVTAFRQAMALNPQLPLAQTEAGLAYYALGEFERARSSCEPARAHWRGQSCLALVYEKLGRHTDAQAMLAEVRSRFGDTGAYGYTYIYAQWGQINESLRWLDTALRRRDTDLLSLPADPLMDPLRNEPRFRAIESALKLPED